MNAGAAEFQESLASVAGQQRRDVELALTVEAAMFRRDLTPQQPIGADDLRLDPAKGIAGGEIDDQQMIAEFVEGADIAPHQCPRAVGDGAAFFIKDLVAQALRLADFLASGDADFEIAEPA